LPLISYGRTSTVVTMCAIGLLLRIHSEVRNGGTPAAGNAPARRPARSRKRA